MSWNVSTLMGFALAQRVLLPGPIPAFQFRMYGPMGDVHARGNDLPELYEYQLPDTVADVRPTAKN